MLAIRDDSHSSDEDGNGNRNGSSRQYFLARVIQTSPEDDSLAIQHSILRDSHQRESLERNWGRYILAWPVMHILAVYVMAKDLMYWLLIRPTDKKRQLLGPVAGTVWFDGAHPYGQGVRNGVTTSEALDRIYSVDLAIPHPSTIGERLVRFWLDQPDGQAVRNRLRLTYRAIRGELERRFQSGQKETRFLVLACGSAQASIEATADFLQAHPEARVELVLVDLNEASLRRAVRLATARGVSHSVYVVVENLKDFVSEPDGKWDLVEMVGFLDYRPRKSVVWICSQIRRILKPGGMFVGAHICPNPWQFVVRWVINWPLLRRRQPREYRRLLHKCFYPDEVERFEVEPNHIYVVSSCRKRADTA